MDENYLLTYMPLLAVLVEVLSFIRFPSQNVITFAGHFKETQWRSIVEAIINLSGSLILVVFFEKIWGLGIYGALIGTVVALLYRTNDIFIYTNKKLLNRNPFAVYKTCIINIVISTVLVLGYRIINPTLDGYMPIVLMAVILCTIMVPLSLVLSFATNKNAREVSINLIKRALKKR